MYSKILFNPKLPVRHRLKNLVAYFFVKRGARLAWKDMFGRFYRTSPENFRPAAPDMEKKHAAYWSCFSRKVNLSTYRVCRNISGVDDMRYIPEEIYIADIESTLNRDVTIDYLSNKSIANHWFPEGIFPKDYFHNIDGEYLDASLNPISYAEMESISGSLNYPVVIKPNRDSYGGKDVFFPRDPEELLGHAKSMKNFVVQERIRQHEFFDRYNRHGLNTLRLVLYRSVKDNRLHVINISMRMGIGGGLDNLSSGGILTFIRKDGTMNGFALNKFGLKYTEHPDSHLKFTEKIPDIDKLIELAKRVTHKIFYARIVSLDACYDANSTWRLVEANVLGQHTIKFAQNAGQPFFGEFTDEVVEYCEKNRWALTYNPGR